MRFRPDHEIIISIQAGASRTPVIAYDLRTDRVHDDITSYGVHLSRHKLLDHKTVYGALYQVARFEAFLENKGLPRSAISDGVLLKFRRELIERAPERSHKHRTRAYAATVNASLSVAYEWIHWLQKTGRVPPTTIGPYPASVRSELLPNAISKREVWSKPLLLPGSGKSSLHKPLGFVPDSETREAVLEHFHSSVSEYAGLRNALMQRVVERVGLRRGSLLSLRASAFEREKLDSCEFEKVDVTPPEQKFGYEDAFAFPLDLAYDVCSFIEGARSRLLSRLGIEAERVVDAVFLSERTGVPLTPGTVSKIFREAMKVAGAPSGAAVHAWRHKFAQDAVDREIEYRLAMGLEVSDQAVTTTVSLQLGHKSPDSALRYVLSAHSKRRRNPNRRRGDESPPN